MLYEVITQAIEAAGLKALEVATDPADGICLDRLAEVLDHQRGGLASGLSEHIALGVTIDDRLRNNFV